MAPYLHTQKATLLLWILIPGALASACGSALIAASSLPIAAVVGATACVLLLCAFVFSSLRVSVSPSEITLSFGPGWIRKKFLAADITSAAIVRNRWFYGWGIHLTPHGWLYNVSGFDAVEITLRNGRKYRIGTDDPQRLHDAISSSISTGRDTSPLPSTFT